VQRYASAAEFRSVLKNARVGILTTTESEARTVLMPQSAATGTAAHVSQAPATDFAQPEPETRILDRGATTPMAAAGTAVPPRVVNEETELATRVQKASSAGRNRLTGWYVAGSLGVLLLGCLGIYGWKQRASHWSQPAAVESSAPASIPQSPSPAPSPEAPATAMEEAPVQDEPTSNGESPSAPAGRSAQSQITQQKKKRPETAQQDGSSDETDPGMSEETQREVQQALREAEAARRNGERLRQAGERWKDFNRSKDFSYPQPPSAPGNGNPVPNPANNTRKAKARVFTIPNPDGSITTTVIRPNGQVTTYTKNPDGTFRGKPVVTPAP
jgi:hypothetical protein